MAQDAQQTPEQRKAAFDEKKRQAQAGQRPAPGPQTAVVLSAPPALLLHLPAGQMRHGNLETLHAALLDLAPKIHLLSPTINPDLVPEFHEVSIRLVVVDARDEAGEVYKPVGARTPDERALTKVALDRIAAAAGISWDPTRSGRLDDRSDPHYCHFRAVGFLRDLDGSRRTISGEKEIDLREGTPTIFTDDPARMKHKWVNKQPTNQIENEGYVNGWSAARLAGQREHILSMAESKAKNRAVRSLGVKQKYDISELQQKPFAVLALVLTGRSDDPVMQRRAQERMLDAAVATSREIYPNAAPTPIAQVPPAIEQAAAPDPPHAPPPLALREREPGDEDDELGQAQPCCGCPAPGHFEDCPQAGQDAPR